MTGGGRPLLISSYTKAWLASLRISVQLLSATNAKWDNHDGSDDKGSLDRVGSDGVRYGPGEHIMSSCTALSFRGTPGPWVPGQSV